MDELSAVVLGARRRARCVSPERIPVVTPGATAELVREHVAHDRPCLWTGWVVQLKGSRRQRRLLAVSPHHFLTIKSTLRGPQVSKKVHLLEVAVAALHASSLEIVARDRRFVFEDSDVRGIFDALCRNLAVITNGFPAEKRPELTLRDGTPWDGSAFEEDLFAEPSPVSIFRAMCSYVDAPVHPGVAGYLAACCANPGQDAFVLQDALGPRERACPAPLARALAESLHHCWWMKALVSHGVRLDESAAASLYELASLDHLRALSVRGGGDAVARPPAVGALVGALRARAAAPGSVPLAVLDLSDFRLSGPTLEPLLLALRSASPPPPALRLAGLRCAGPAPTALMEELLGSPWVHGLRALDLSATSLGPAGGMGASALLRAATSLEHFAAGGTGAPAVPLLQAFAANQALVRRTLRSLSLDGLAIDDASVGLLVSFARASASLRALSLRACKLAGSSVAALLAGAAANDHAEFGLLLDASDNPIGAGGAAAIVDALQSTAGAGLRGLFLARCGLADAAAAALLQALHMAPPLQALSLSGNIRPPGRFGGPLTSPHGLASLLDCSPSSGSHVRLRVLVLRGDRGHALGEGAVKVAEALGGASLLEECDLSWHDAGDALAEAMRACATGASRLRSLHVDGNALTVRGLGLLAALVAAHGRIVALPDPVHDVLAERGRLAAGATRGKGAGGAPGDVDEAIRALRSALLDNASRPGQRPNAHEALALQQVRRDARGDICVGIDPVQWALRSTASEALADPAAAAGAADPGR